MTVYIDDRRAPFDNTFMCRMISDNAEELHNLARRIGIPRRFYGGDHYDVAWWRRQKAIDLGAVEITERALNCMGLLLCATGSFGTPEAALAYCDGVVEPVE